MHCRVETRSGGGGGGGKEGNVDCSDLEIGPARRLPLGEPLCRTGAAGLHCGGSANPGCTVSCPHQQDSEQLAMQALLLTCFRPSGFRPQRNRTTAFKSLPYASH